MVSKGAHITRLLKKKKKKKRNKRKGKERKKQKKEERRKETYCYAPARGEPAEGTHCASVQCAASIRRTKARRLSKRLSPDKHRSAPVYMRSDREGGRTREDKSGLQRKGRGGGGWDGSETSAMASSGHLVGPLRGICGEKKLESSWFQVVVCCRIESARFRWCARRPETLPDSNQGRRSDFCGGQATSIV